MYPLLTADCAKLKHNIDRLVSACHGAGVAAAIVTKALLAHPAFAALIEESDADMIADSRVQNLEKLAGKKPRLLLRPVQKSEIDRAVACADYSLESELSSIALLEDAAARMGKRHGVCLMIDLGDLREGIWFENRTLIMDTARAAASAKHLFLAGIGTNLTCFGGVLPDEKNLGTLCEIASELETALGRKLPIVSGGNSSSVGLLLSGALPKGITHLRLGESVLLGNDTAALCTLPGLYADAFTLTAELIEVQDKQSVPFGTAGVNAFGEAVAFSGSPVPMRRGILALGRQDVDEKGLVPRDPRVKVLGASSDHLIVDLSEAEEYAVGDTLSFTPAYGALLRAATSPYVEKRFE